MGKERGDSSSSKSSQSRSRSRSRHRSRSPKRRSRRSRSGSGGSESFRVHISDLSLSCSTSELEKTFGKFGPLVEVWKTNSTPCFAFVVFQHKNDAEEAIRVLNGQNICGSRVRVTMALPRARERRRHAMFNSDARCYQCGRPGHFSRNCRNYEGAGRNKMIPSPRRRSWRRSASSSRSRSRSPRTRDRRRSRDRKSREGRSRDRRSRSRDRRKSPENKRSSRDRDKSRRRESKDDDVNPDDIIAAQM